MKTFLLLFYFTLVILSCPNTHAQTAGSGTLATIESLAKQENANSERMAKLNRKHMDTYVSEDLKLKRLTQEQMNLQQQTIVNQIQVAQRIENKKHEITTSSSWQNRLKSAQSGYKEYNPGRCSAGGPPPICVANHWYLVSVQEAMAEYNALVQKEFDKITKDLNKYQNALLAKNEELRKFQFEDNEFAQKRDNLNTQMNEIQAENQALRKRIAQLSKKYVALVEEQAKKSQQSLIKDIMYMVAEKNFSELKTVLIDAKFQKLDEEEKLARDNARERLRLQNEKDIKTTKDQINNKKRELINLETALISNNKPIKKELRDLQNERSKIKGELKKTSKYNQQELDSLLVIHKDLDRQINSIKEDLKQRTETFRRQKTLIENEIKILDDEAWQLQINLPQLQNKYVLEIEKAFEAKRQIIRDALEGRKHRTQEFIRLIETKKASFRQKIKSYSNTLEDERLRLMSACKQSGASCWGSDIVSKIWSNANGLISCTSINKYNSVTYQTGECVKAYDYYKTVYNRFVGGISDQDLSTFKKSRYSYKYSDILGNFNAN
ncbi:coiled-coil domain-containing protein [Psychroserpens luteolus]|uniref:hypothetical protein n=1 Tax=Psychroserpens luteolus TaxID=2855840 RepID=UPI001E364A0F|nr:hypothetical protein [Psychroserpens luteolus]MCD2260074.1 hypothetical protein [Psychroserpens luteolus]